MFHYWLSLVNCVDQRDHDEEMAKYFDEVDAKMEERMEEEVLMKERKIFFLASSRSMCTKAFRNDSICWKLCPEILIETFSDGGHLGTSYGFSLSSVELLINCSTKLHF
jgi:hypothetical protein